MSNLAIGVDLGGTYIKMALVRHSVGILHQEKIPTGADDGPEHILNQITAGIRSILASVSDEMALVGIGVGSPGVISLDQTTVHRPPNFPGWGHINLAEVIPDRIGQDIRVTVDNDANAAGLGSAHYGAGKPHPTFVMVTLGTGVGGAIIVNNRIFRGSTGAAGEIGHVSIDYEGPMARSGVAGAAEAYLGQKFLSRYARFYLLNREDSVVHKMAGRDLKDITPHILHDAAIAGDAGAIEVFEWAGHKLGCLLGSIATLLDIHVAIVGGGVSKAGDFILEPARRALNRSVMPTHKNTVQIIQETLGNDVGVLGAAHLAFHAAGLD